MAKKRHLLPSAAYVNGGTIQIPLRDAPPLARIRAFVIRLEALFTTGGAAAAIASTQLHRLIDIIDVGPNHRASGQYWHMLEWLMRGGETSLPAGLPAVNAQTYRRHITWVVPFRDRRAQFPADGEPVGADFRENAITIQCAQFATLGAGDWATLASIAGTFRVEAILDDANGSPGSVVKHGFADLTGQSPTILEPGLYTDLFVYRESAATISSAEIATAAIQVDGQAYHDAIRLSEYARAFNDAHATGSALQAASATVPVAGELLPESPAVTAGAADTVTVPVLPLAFPDPSFKLTKNVIRVEQSLRIDFTGTDTTFRVGYRKIAPRSPAEAIAAFHRIGRTDVRSTSQIRVKTGSKRPLKAAKQHFARYLPLAADRAA